MTVSTDRLFRYEGEDGTPLAGYVWQGRATPRAVVQLAHGAGEHAGRYRARFQPLLDEGYLIYAADHRGHGLTSGMGGLGDFGPGGAAAAVADMAVLSRRIREERPDLPLVLFGHSMGAMFAQAYLPDHAALIDALVLSGTAAPGERIAGDLNARFPEKRTAYDWLSRDPDQVDAYIADPLCGIRFTDNSARSFAELRTRPVTANLPTAVRGMPAYVFVGDQDPINDDLRRIHPLVEAYRAAGLAVTTKVYEGGRHEMLNETNRDAVVADLLGWLDTEGPTRAGR